MDQREIRLLCVCVYTHIYTNIYVHTHICIEDSYTLHHPLKTLNKFIIQENIMDSTTDAFKDNFLQKVLKVLSTPSAKELSKLWEIHVKPVHTRTLSLEDVHLFLAGSPVDTRIHLNPSKRVGGRKLRSNFRSIKTKILPQYNTNIFSLGALPEENSHPAVTVALWRGVCIQEPFSMMLLVSNYRNLHTLVP